MKIGILAITEEGKRLAAKIRTEMPASIILKSEKGVGSTFAECWHQFDGFVCIMATGIVVRAIAPLLADKRKDPCVVVIDQKGLHAISLLSGHLGGGNELARHVANITGGVAVITTASDTLGLVALDLWARDLQLAASKETLTRASSTLVNRGSLKLFTDLEMESLPRGLIFESDPDLADIVVSHETPAKNKLTFHPRNLVVGVGCNRGTPLEEFEEALEELFHELGFSPLSIRNLASIDLKNDEKGLLAFAEKNGWQIDFYNREAINQFKDLEISQAALKAVGAIGVAEPTALLSAQNTILLSRKRKWQNITMAVAQVSFTL